MASKSSAVRFWRSVHLYFGLFISPALLFFALTGIAQTLSLHEPAGSSYKPPAWLATMGQIHKKQTWQVPVRREGFGPPAGNNAPSSAVPGNAPDGRPQGDRPGAERHGRDRDELAPRAPQAPEGAQTAAAPLATLRLQAGPSGPPPRTLAAKERQHLPLKIFFVIASLGLIVSTATGIYMAYVYRNSRLWVTVALFAGVVLPLVLLPF